MSPRFEKVASVPFSWEAATQRMFVALTPPAAGERWYSHGNELWSSSLSSRLVPSFPEAKTKRVFAQAGDVIALETAVFGKAPPKLPLTTSAPFWQA